MSRTVDERIARVLLVAATVGVTAAMVCAFGWQRAASRRAEVGELSAEERQELVSEMLERSPGVYASAWYEPRIAYTLHRNRRLTAWNDTFRSNRLGYRTGPATKAPGTFRVVFVGDSWTFGLGVSEAQSYPKAFERVAQAAGPDREIEAWTLALPGYNCLAENAALWFFYERLRPDAVVFAPTLNDNHSMAAVLPNGSPTSSGVRRDGFGDEHMLVYRIPRLSSHRYLGRWRRCFEVWRESEERLRRFGVPVMFFFAARWQEDFVHRLVQEGGLESPYLITPRKFTAGEAWLNPKPHGHANAQANGVFGRMVYQGLAEVLGWPKLPPASDGSDVPLHDGPPRSQDWIATNDESLDASTRELIAESFRPSPASSGQCAGPIDPATGLMERATTILVRKADDARYLRIAVRRVEESPSLYPLELTVSIPSAGGGRRVRTTVPADGPAVHRFTVPIPEEIPAGKALDVGFLAARTAVAPRGMAPRSVYVEAIDQEQKSPGPGPGDEGR